MVRIALIALLCLAAGPVMASGLDDKMEQMFNTMSNTTAPGASMGPRRGTLYGGSFQMRTQIVRPGPVLNLQPPRVSGGCGGIDLFGGSFSAVSVDQFKDLGRAVASNAAGYAFELALKSICDGCAQTMQRLGDVVRSYNFQMMDSCQIAQGIAHPDEQVREQRRAEMSATWERLSGAARDFMSAGNHSARTNESPAQSLVRENSELAQKVMGGNAMWEVLKASRIWESLGVSSTTGRLELMQDIMSMTGTVIACQPATAGCEMPTGATAGDREDMSFRVEPELRLRFKDLINGSEGENVVGFYRCNGGFNGACTDIRPDTRVMKGMKERFIERLVGPVGNSEAGLIYRYRNQVGAPSAADLGILGAGGEFTTRVIRYTKANPGIAEEFVREFAAQVSAEVMKKEVDRLFVVLRAAVARHETPHRDKLLLLMANAQSGVNQDFQEILASAQTKSNVLAHYDMREERAIGTDRARLQVYQ